MEKNNLLNLSRGSGCGCKIAPAVLEVILRSSSTPSSFNHLLVGNQTKDDAAVFQLDEHRAIISTTDFFTPIVQDPFQFGQIAAANAISDVYAMGGTPLMAVAILGWPIDTLPAELAQQVVEGGRSICSEAGIPLAGGHTIDSIEPIFGLAVTGEVAPTNIKRNNTAQENDLLFLTKPLGTGILAAALKKTVLSENDYQLLITQLTQLNKVGTALAQLEGVHAMTDITGFGLIGHLLEMTEGSNLSATIQYNSIPIIEVAKSLLTQRIVPDATYRNWNAYNKEVAFEKGVPVMEAFSILPDPQTNGGLLIAASEGAKEAVIDVLKQHGLANFTKPIGQMGAFSNKRITVAL